MSYRDLVNPEGLRGARMIQRLRQLSGDPINFSNALSIWNRMKPTQRELTTSAFNTVTTINHLTEQGAYMRKDEQTCLNNN